MAKTKKLTREERLERKRHAEKLRYQRIKNDPDRYALQKEKERLKYAKKKEKGIVKTVDQMNPREKRKSRKIWREKAKIRRARLALKDISNAPTIPPRSDGEITAPAPRANPDRRIIAAKKKSDRARRIRYKVIKKQAELISQLKTKIERYKKRLHRLKPSKEFTPNTKVQKMLDSPSSRETIKKKLLFGEVIGEQLRENFNSLSTNKEKRIFRRVISGKLIEKYGVLQNERVLKPLKKQRKIKLEESKRREKSNYKIQKKKIIEFLIEDCNTRLCAGKKDSIKWRGEHKQKRVLLDTLYNLHKSFLKTSGIIVSYPVFCRLIPKWIIPARCDKRETCLCVTHANLDLTLSALHKAKITSLSTYQNFLNQICCNRYNEQCLSRKCQICKNKSLVYKEFDNTIPIIYRKWQTITEIFVDPKTKKTKKVTKYTKKIFQILPRDLIYQLEANVESFLQHELNIVHQYSVMKTKKKHLTQKDAIIHMDFSENYLTKYAEEIQSFHFGGSRQQISLHTVVTYTKDNEDAKVEPTSYCTMSTNLSHSPPAIWAHLQPILNRLPVEIENLHFLSDGPVTQYRNKCMFYMLVTYLVKFYPNLISFTWNYHEAGHGKGAPDGVGGVCKKTADDLVARGTDMSCLKDVAEAISTKCPNVKIFVINDSEICKKEALLHEVKLKTFSGTLRVHQVSGNICIPNKLQMKTLSCFCEPDCSHFKIGTITYPSIKSRLYVEDVYGKDSEDELESRAEKITEDENRSNLETAYERETQQMRIKNVQDAELEIDFEIELEPDCKTENEQEASTSSKRLKNGDFILVKLFLKSTEYRYVALCTGVEEDDEIQVIYCKIADKTGKLFKIDEKDVAFITWDQIVEELPFPCIKMKGERMYYAFKNAINVFEHV